VVAVWIDPSTLTAARPSRDTLRTTASLPWAEYFIDYTVPNPAVETRDALNERIRVHGRIQIDVANATAGDSFVLYVVGGPQRRHRDPSNIDTGTAGTPSTDVLTVQASRAVRSSL
jgi:hypothetical protein